jgi:DNA-binding NarL/FixJ family response regulator
MGKGKMANLKVLVVDDEFLIRNYFKNVMLEDLGMEIAGEASEPGKHWIGRPNYSISFLLIFVCRLWMELNSAKQLLKRSAYKDCSCYGTRRV